MASINLRQSLRSPWAWGVPLFASVAMLVMGLNDLNQSLFIWMNHWLYIQPEAFWINVTLFGDAGMLMILMLPLVGRRPDVIWAGFLTAIITTLVVNGGKEFFNVERPPMVLAEGSFHQLGNRFSSFSFPSGHTSAAFALAGVFALAGFHYGIRVAALVFAICVGLSRIAVGAHWPFDVAGGMLVGWVSAIAGLGLSRIIPGENIVTQRISSAILVLTVIYLVFFHLDGDQEARFLEITVPLLCLALGLKGLRSVFIPTKQTSAT